jgi:polysaccharide pyruvyl transferase CsaB
VVISGYYGYNNSGDDMLLRAIIAPLREAQPDMKITVLSRRPKETRLHYGVNAVYRFNFPYVFFTLRKANLLITGGGSLIQDETSTQSLVYYLWLINTARHFGMKNMLYGNGIGPLLNPGNIRRASRALNKTDLITLRDGESLGLLQEIGVTAPETHLTADPAFALPAADEADAQARLAVLGINGPFCCVAIRAWKHNPPHLERTVAAFTDEVSKQYGYSILFVAMNPSEDTEISKNAMQLMKTPSVLLTASPLAKETDRIRGVVGCASLMLGMRLHALIYAMEKSVPMIGLVYGPKIRRLMDTLGQRFYMPVEEADTSEMLRLAETIHADRDACLTGILKAGRQAREKAAVNAKLCAALLARP